ncbi:MAG: biopolymer transporter ExbD [bacterium]|nr:biopolymer transporter ExbD [bacterium]
MKFKRVKLKEAGLDITPLIDVVFLLLIFFLLSSSFIMQPGIKVTLPEATTDDIKTKKDVFVTITRDGSYFLNEEAISLAVLPDKLRVMVAGEVDQLLIVKADREVTHGRVVEVMDIAKRAGIDRLAIATEPKRK